MTAKRITFVAPPFAGHLNPLLELAQAAAQANHDVTVITGDAKLAAVKSAGLQGSALVCLNGHMLEKIANTDHAVGNNPWRLLSQLRQSLDVTAAACDELTILWQKSPPDLIVADSIAVAAGLVATRFHIPWMTTIATPFAIESRHGTPSYVGGWTEESSMAHHVRDAVGRLMVRSVKKGLAFAVRHQLKTLGTTLYRKDGSEALYSPLSIVGFGLKELEFARDWPSCFKMIGPLFHNPETTIMLTLPAGRPSVLITLGTHLPWAKANLAEDIKWLAARRSDVTFVGSLGQTGATNNLRQLNTNAFLYDFVSYTDHLSSFDTVIHHGGAGITYAAIAAGKPAVVVPHDYDQFDYAARVVAKGAGLRIKNLRSTATLSALDQALAPENFPNLTTLADAANGYKPKEEFLAEAMRLIGS